MFEIIKRGAGAITELLLLLVGLAIVIQVLFGSDGAIMPIDVVANLGAAAGAFSGAGAAGLVAIGLLMWIFHKRSLGAREAPPPAVEASPPPPPAYASGPEDT